jgi:Spy/CpxP family protein refolding chaperone
MGMLKKVMLLVAVIAIVASTQVFAADEAPAVPAKPGMTPPPPPARDRTQAAGQGMGRGMGMGGMGMGRGMDVTAMFQGLDLTEEQKTKMQEIQKGSAEKTQAAQQAQMTAMMKLNGVANSGGSEADIRAAAADLGKAMGEVYVIRAGNVSAMKALLTAEQKAKFDEQAKQRQEQMNQMGQMGGGRGQRGPGQDGERPAAPPRPSTGEQK